MWNCQHDNWKEILKICHYLIPSYCSAILNKKQLLSVMSICDISGFVGETLWTTAMHFWHDVTTITVHWSLSHALKTKLLNHVITSESSPFGRGLERLYPLLSYQKKKIWIWILNKIVYNCKITELVRYYANLQDVALKTYKTLR